MITTFTESVDSASTVIVPLISEKSILFSLTEYFMSHILLSIYAFSATVLLSDDIVSVIT